MYIHFEENDISGLTFRSRICIMNIQLGRGTLLNMSHKIPKYKEIADEIWHQIQTGKLKAGDQVMTENELCEHYGVSRMTVRKALESLAAEGIVRRTAGKGTFVNSIRVEKSRAVVTSFSEDIRSAGMEIGRAHV